MIATPTARLRRRATLFTSFLAIISLAVVAISPPAAAAATAAAVVFPTALATFTATPTPLITGNAVVGQTLAASPGRWLPAGGTLTYQWNRVGSATVLGTASSYLLVGADVNSTITVTVTNTLAGYTPVSKTSAPTTSVLQVLTDTPIPTIFVSGTLTVGSTLSARTGSWAPSGVNFGYQWFRGTAAILNATSEDYLLTPADRLQAISVRVTGTKTGYLTVSQNSARTALVGNGILSPTPVPTISGTPIVAGQLRAIPGTWGASPVALSYQWFRGSSVITGATGETYTVVPADLGELLSVAVSGTKNGYTSVTQPSAKTAPVAAATLSPTPTPTIRGAAVVGQKLTAVPGTWALAPVNFSYEWNRNGVPISGAPQLPSYTLTNADAGSVISVTVTGTKAGYESVPKVSDDTDSVLRALAATPTPTLSGTAQVASMLTAAAGVWGPGTVTLDYVWKRGTSVIASAHSDTYTLTPADKGKTITVSVVGSRDGYASVTQKSSPSPIVAPALLTASPVPTIGGSPVVGNVLTLASGIWGPSPVGLSYQWSRGNTAISRATATTYTLTAADLGQKISVSVTGSKDGYTSITRSSATTAVVTAGVLSSTPIPEIAGYPTVGETLEVTSTSWAPAPVTLSYRWMRDAAVISGANRASYKLVGADLGAEISVIVTGAKAGFTSVTTTSEPTAPVEVAVFGDTENPVITGVASVGQTLTANPGVWTPAATTLLYRWKRDGVLINGSPNGPEYIISSGDVGYEITVTVTGSRAGYGSLTFTSDPTEAILDLLTATPRPTVIGSAIVGQTLRAAVGTWLPSPVVLAHQWKRGGVAIGGADSERYTLAPGDVGKAITVTITGTKPGFTPVSMTSVATPLVAPGVLTATPTPTISGTVQVGETLTALAGTWLPATVGLRFQWNRGTTAIGGATSPTYDLSITDQGAPITVTVTGSKDGFTVVSKTSVATSAVAGATFTLSPVPTVAGNLRVGQPLTGTPGTWGPAPVALAYQWYRGAAAITGATSPSYTLTPSDASKVIKLTVTGSKDGYATLSRESLPTAEVQASPLSATPTPTISETPALGSTLTAVAGTWLPATVTLSYQWYRGTDPIDRATTSTYLVVAADVGTRLSVKVTGSKTGYTTVTKQSDATIEIPLGILTATPKPTVTGTAIFGRTLTAVAGTWRPAPVALTYQWNRGTDPIDDATGQTYVVGLDDIDETISVTVTGTKLGYAEASRTSDDSARVVSAAFTTTPIPTVTGTRTVGSTLIGATAAWIPAPSLLTYQWLRDGEAIDDADGLTYLLTADDAAAVITFSVTASLAGYTQTTRVSASGAPIPGQQFTSTAVPVISGDLVVGETLTADPGTWDPVPDSFTYIWKRGTTAGSVTTVIANANTDSYVLTPADLNARITVTATAILPQYNRTSAVSAVTAAVAAGTMAVDPAPTISGDPSVGEQLTVDPGAWVPDTATFTYAWMRDGVAISPAKTLATYTVVVADEGHELTVAVTGHATGYTNRSVTTDPVTPAAPTPFDTAPKPEISGDAVVGEILTVDAGAWDPEPDSLTYVWKRGGVAITPAATGTSYLLTAADAGAAITVTVTARLATYATTSTTSNATSAVLRVLTATPIPTITGTVAVGSPLTAVTGTWSPAPVALSYQWSNSGTPILSATSATYRPVAADLDGILTVAVTGTKAGYRSETVTSAESSTVVAGTFTTTPTPTVTGTRTVGSLLTAATTAWLPTPDPLEYQWLRNGDPVTDATGLTYRLVADDAGAYVTFSVIASRDGYTTATRVSANGSLIPGQSYVATAVPTISGTLAVGETLTADPGTWDPEPTSFTYVWKRGATAGSVTTVIAGATSDSYVLTGADLNARITVTASAILTRYNVTSTVSAATAAVAVGTLTASTAPSISGDPTVGQVLTADPGVWVPNTATFTYLWIRDGVAISPAKTSATYTVVNSDRGHDLTVVVTGHATGYTDLPLTTDPVTPAAPTPFDTAPIPVVTGDAVVGETLTVDAGTWDPAPDSLTYLWKRDGVAITPAATDTSYLLASADAGAVITVTVTARLTNYATTSTTSVATSSVLRVLTATPIPTFTGTLAVGSLLTAVPGTWSPAPVGFTYVWSNNGTPIDGATVATYRLVAADLDAVITVSVTGTKTGYVPVTQTSADSAAVVAGTFATTPTPTVSGTIAVGETLTAVPGTWAPVPDSFTYVWKRDGVAITPAATGSSYLVTAADAGSAISVAVTAEAAGYATASTTSLSTATVTRSFSGPYVSVAAHFVHLGDAVNYAVLAATAVTDAGAIAIRGELGVSPGTTVTGFPPGIVSDGSVHSGDEATSAAQADAQAAYAQALAQSSDLDVGTVNLAEAGPTGAIDTLAPGVYSSASSLNLAGTLYLDAQGDSNAVFLFQAGSTLTIGSSSQIVLTNGAQSGNVFWQVGSSATLGANSTMVGTILAYTAIIAAAGIALEGRLIALGTAVTLDGGSVTIPSAPSASVVPTPVITGTATVGSLLTAVRGTWSPAPDTFTYVWKRDAVVIDLPPISTYRLVSADVGAVITVTITGAKTGYRTTSVTSAATSLVIE